MKTFATLATLILLAACGQSTNPDDVAFMQGMIPHHEQAIEMAELAPSAGASPDVLGLAAAIQAAQDPEIKTMEKWLRAHDEPIESEHGHHAMAGMASDDDLDALSKARGTEFDRQFLALMIAHHRGAIEMATGVIDKGSDAEVEQLAEAIIKAQQAEIDTMTRMQR